MRLFPEARFPVSYQVIVLIEGETLRTKKSLNVHLVATCSHPFKELRKFTRGHFFTFDHSTSILAFNVSLHFNVGLIETGASHTNGPFLLVKSACLHISRFAGERICLQLHTAVIQYAHLSRSKLLTANHIRAQKILPSLRTGVLGIATKIIFQKKLVS